MGTNGEKEAKVKIIIRPSCQLLLALIPGVPHAFANVSTSNVGEQSYCSNFNLILRVFFTFSKTSEIMVLNPGKEELQHAAWKSSML